MTEFNSKDIIIKLTANGHGDEEFLLTLQFCTQD